MGQQGPTTLLQTARYADELACRCTELPFETVPFYTLTATANGLWRAGGDGLYAITAGRPMNCQKMPTFERIDGVHISFAVPGLVLAHTDIDAHVSLGGGAPLLVAR